MQKNARKRSFLNVFLESPMDPLIHNLVIDNLDIYLLVFLCLNQTQIEDLQEVLRLPLISTSMCRIWGLFKLLIKVLINPSKMRPKICITSETRIRTKTNT